MELYGPLAAGYLTGNFDVTSVSSAASTGIMSFVDRQWNKKMLGALAQQKYRTLAWKQLPKIVGHYEPVGPLSENLATEAGVDLISSGWITHSAPVLDLGLDIEIA